MSFMKLKAISTLLTVINFINNKKNTGRIRILKHSFVAQTGNLSYVGGGIKSFLRPAWAIKVPRGHVWLEGDNLQNSTDSRYYGPIPYGLIRGRIFFKLQRKSETSLHTTQLWRKGHKRTQQGSCLHKDRTDQHHPELLSLQNYEKFCLAAQSVVFCYGSPSRLMGILQIKQDQAKSASKNKALQKCKGLLVICS
ncbi:mitochondrial inner membrane protease subunit 1 isoform X3 [Nannospalax galili]|uniref:mitochondrial inner membrane protease subunit 1 isoform X3 n=1 Tax=Nannospalax galili TaxID=1026970 RepID=UPI00111BF9D2|nr:mitochondrial inner membrane protease subunit 1 isoform X3 [Nannospalax galili]